MNVVYIINNILTIIGLIAVALFLPCVIISVGTWLWRRFAKPTTESMDDKGKTSQTSIYIPQYIKKLGYMSPQLIKNCFVHTSKNTPNPKYEKNKVLVEHALNVINSPITEFEESPSGKPLHPDTLAQEKNSCQPKVNDT
jgi:hypothetical protein